MFLVVVDTGFEHWWKEFSTRLEAELFREDYLNGACRALLIEVPSSTEADAFFSLTGTA